MASRRQKRTVLRKKLHVLRALIGSKSVKKCSIIMDTIFYIYALKLRLEAVKRVSAIKLKQEVRVEKVREGFLVRVICEKDGNALVSILECFEEMRLNVLQAKVTSNNYFAMEAIVEAQDQALDAKVVYQAVDNAIPKQSGCTYGN